MKAVILSLALISAALTANAETVNQNETQTPAAEWKIIPVLGMNSFSISGSTAASQAKSGSSLGLLVEQKSSIDNLSYQYGVSYMQAGGKQNDFWTETQVTLTYLAIPLGVKYQFNDPKRGAVKYFGTAGLMPAMLMSAESSFKDYWYGNSANTDIKSNLKSTDFMAKIGFGGSYELGSGDVVIDLEYIRGLTKVSDSFDGVNQGYSVNAGYSFNL